MSWLGVDAIWIAPCYASPGFGHGYDLSDYYGINPIHSTLEDFDDLATEAHSLELRVIVDIVPNHSSSVHEWFQQAIQGRDNRYRDYYLWRDPAPNGGPPNNWVSHFGVRPGRWTKAPVSTTATSSSRNSLIPIGETQRCEKSSRTF